MNLLRIIGLIASFALFVTAVLDLAYIVAAFVLTIITSLFITT